MPQHYPALLPGDADNDYSVVQVLPFIRLLLDLTHNIHTPYDFPEGGETLTIGIAPAPEIEFRLIPDADEELR